MSEKNQPKEPIEEKLAGLAIIASLIIPIAGFMGAVAAASMYDWTGAGTCLIASAISTGFLLNAVLRK